MKGFTTKAIHTRYLTNDPHGTLHMPVYDSVAFEYSSAEEIEAAFQGKKQGHMYSRITNPTVEHLENTIKQDDNDEDKIELLKEFEVAYHDLSRTVDIVIELVIENVFWLFQTFFRDRLCLNR